MKLTISQAKVASLLIVFCTCSCSGRQDTVENDFSVIEGGAYDILRHDGISNKKWIEIQPAMFYMGSPASEPCRELGSAKESLHQVKISNAFRMLSHEVTTIQFTTTLGYNPSGRTDCPSCAVNHVNWHEAASYCNELSRIKGLTLCYECKGKGKTVECALDSTFAPPTGNIIQCEGYRLPTEAEWEHAYRAGSKSALYNGKIDVCSGKSSKADQIAWYSANSTGASTKKVHVVGEKTPNMFGLFDMSGNVFEWCNDFYVKDLGIAYAIDPMGPAIGSTKVTKGGAVGSPPAFLRGAARTDYAASTSNYSSGFRVVISGEAKSNGN